MRKGFTVVELLIVIVVIGVLATLTIIAYSGVQQQTRDAKIKQDISKIVMAVKAARDKTGKTFSQLTGSTATGGTCWSKVDGTDLAALAQSDSCWVNYWNALNILKTASGINLGNMVDPWGRPYLLDENEGEGGGCGTDTVAVFKQPFTTGFGVYSGTSSGNVPRSGYSGCSL